MLRFGTVLVLVTMFVSGAIVSCSGGSVMDDGLGNVPATEAPGSELLAIQDAATSTGFPAFPSEPPQGSSGKSASWVYNVDPQTPLAAHRTYNCPAHPGGLVLEGLYSMPLTHVPPPPYFAYSFYEAPLGTAAPDLLTMVITGEVSVVGEEYYVGIANYTAMAWEWFGPEGVNPTFSVDFPSLGWDYTSPWDSMYFVVVVPQANRLHLKDIKLNFDEPGDPTWWNVWGRAYQNIAAGSVLGGASVEFTDTTTLAIYTTTTAADGNWGMNLPTGTYKFNVIGNEMLFDEINYVMIEVLEVTLELSLGDMIYHGPNAAYDGNITPMPIITCNSF